MYSLILDDIEISLHSTNNIFVVFFLSFVNPVLAVNRDCTIFLSYTLL